MDSWFMFALWSVVTETTHSNAWCTFIREIPPTPSWYQTHVPTVIIHQTGALAPALSRDNLSIRIRICDSVYCSMTLQRDSFWHTLQNTHHQGKIRSAVTSTFYSVVSCNLTVPSLTIFFHCHYPLSASLHIIFESLGEKYFQFFTFHWLPHFSLPSDSSFTYSE